MIFNLDLFLETVPASELKEDYLFAVKKSIVDFVLKEPEIDEDERFLDEDDETPMTIELAGMVMFWIYIPWFRVRQTSGDYLPFRFLNYSGSRPRSSIFKRGFIIRHIPISNQIAIQLFKRKRKPDCIEKFPHHFHLYIFC